MVKLVQFLMSLIINNLGQYHQDDMRSELHTERQLINRWKPDIPSKYAFTIASSYIPAPSKKAKCP